MISTDQIPVIESPLPVYSFCGEFVLPTNYVAAAIPTGISLTPFGKSGDLAAYNGDTLAAFVRSDTGESRIFPSFENLTPGKDVGKTAASVAKQFIGDTSVFPADDTTLVPLCPITLSTSKSVGPNNATTPEQLLGFVQIQRQVGGYPVQGPGSQAAIGVDCGGNIQALAHRYRTAKLTNQYVTAHPPEQIVQSIMNDLAGTCNRDQVIIDNVTVSYWDAGGDYIQPIYTYSGSVPSTDNSSTHSLLTGSIPIGEALESLFPATVTDYPTNETAGFDRLVRRTVNLDATVGRYVVQDDSIQWLNSATAFMSSLQNATDIGGNINFTNQQYLGAAPEEFESNKNDYVNSVNIALTEAHGAFGEFSTYKSDGDIVSLANIGAAGGLGQSAGGNLSYWILHSCAVIATQTDESDSFSAWWDVFQGLHSVLGYRTDMYISDAVTSNLGLYAGLGAPVVPAWFLEIASNNLYGIGSVAYNAERGIDEPVGRASSVSVCGHLDDTFNDLEGLGAAQCLAQVWLDN
jgi:Family of unknown function (DUF6345)